MQILLKNYSLYDRELRTVQEKRDSEPLQINSGGKHNKYRSAKNIEIINKISINFIKNYV